MQYKQFSRKQTMKAIYILEALFLISLVHAEQPTVSCFHSTFLRRTTTIILISVSSLNSTISLKINGI
jgi:hypothetical protein